MHDIALHDVQSSFSRHQKENTHGTELSHGLHDETVHATDQWRRLLQAVVNVTLNNCLTNFWESDKLNYQFRQVHAICFFSLFSFLS